MFVAHQQRSRRCHFFYLHVGRRHRRLSYTLLCVPSHCVVRSWRAPARRLLFLLLLPVLPVAEVEDELGVPRRDVMTPHLVCVTLYLEPVPIIFDFPRLINEYSAPKSHSPGRLPRQALDHVDSGPCVSFPIGSPLFIRPAALPRLATSSRRNSLLTLQIYYLHFPPPTRHPDNRNTFANSRQMIPDHHHQHMCRRRRRRTSIRRPSRRHRSVKGNRDPPRFPCDNRFFIRDIYMKVLPSFPGNNKFLRKTAGIVRRGPLLRRRRRTVLSERAQWPSTITLHTLI